MEHRSPAAPTWDPAAPCTLLALSCSAAMAKRDSERCRASDEPDDVA